MNRKNIIASLIYHMMHAFTNGKTKSVMTDASTCCTELGGITSSVKGLLKDIQDP